MSYPTQQFSRTPPPRLSEAQLRERFWLAYPEALGPAVEMPSGEAQYGVGTEGYVRIGRIPMPSGMDRQRQDAENAEREARWNSMSPGERALAEAEIIRGQAGRRWP
jgi:hypothetical protein